MITAARGQAYSATVQVGITGLVGLIEMQLVDTNGNIVTTASTLNIIELLDEFNIGTGTYVAARVAPMVLGSYVVEFSNDGSFDAETVSAEDMTVVAGNVVPVLPPIPVDPSAGPYNGPCLSWTDGDRVAACCSSAVGTDTSVFDDSVAMASEVLFNLSGRQFPGQCETTVRPCATRSCGFQQLSRGHVIWPADWFYGGTWGWDGGRWNYPAFSGCGCTPLSRVLLAGHPVVDVTEVKVDGVVLNTSEYRLDEYRFLTRMADTNGNPQWWPSCQALDKPDTETGTWSVTYTFGQSPPNIGQQAATVLACEIYKLCADVDDECRLPDGVTRIIRQGITIEKLPTLTWAFEKLRNGASGQWRTGIAAVDLFLNSYNPSGLKRRPTVWSPAFQYARRYG
ncbi:MAG: hypothetical protein OEV86_15790 [Candidatus Krumholzibacteria bacterium]|nr:hypothetical protein [Candidatus Krumholzibacteria bacterium]